MIAYANATKFNSVKTPVAAQPCRPIIVSFDDLPDDAYIRESQLIRNPKYPGRPTPVPISPATLWRKVKAGTFPKPVKLSERVTAWRVGDIRAWMAAPAKV